MTVERWSPEWHRRLRVIIAGLPDRSPEEAATVRRELGKDVIAFAVLYLGHHLRGKETGGQVTFAEAHYEWARLAAQWADPVSEPMESRDAFIAPRGCGKSTWFFLIIPLWAAAHGHVRFVAAFAHSAGQSEGHLQTMKHELDTNPLLRHDFPLLCSPARRPSGTTVADRQSMIHSASGFTFAARGVDAASLGLKVQERRPDALIIDDGEPDESSYSPYLAAKRLSTIVDAIFALNIYARVVMVGTVTMPGSIAHQLVRAGADDPEASDWIGEEKIRVHHHRAILTNDDGTERSIWPEKWPLAWLQGRRHTREFQKNYDNDPAAVDGGYWTRDDFRYGTLGPLATRWVLSIDPAVTTKGTSDWTGLAVVGCRPPGRPVKQPNGPPRVEHPEGLPEWMDPAQAQCEVAKAWPVKLAAENLRREILRTLNEFPKVKVVRIEVNQGGDLWYTALHDLPPGVKLLVHTASSSKEARFAEALGYYQQRQVIHRGKMPAAEDQMTGFPKMQHDDVADGVVAAVNWFLHPTPTVKVSARATPYT